ncbi:MAG: hypothetical protein AAGG38_06405 [Planctomycetota bacterium]
MKTAYLAILSAVILGFIIVTPAQARFVDGMNLYAGYHVMHGRTDPSGLSPDVNMSFAAYIPKSIGQPIGHGGQLTGDAALANWAFEPGQNTSFPNAPGIPQGSGGATASRTVYMFNTDTRENAGDSGTSKLISETNKPVNLALTGRLASKHSNVADFFDTSTGWSRQIQARLSTTNTTMGGINHNVTYVSNSLKRRRAKPSEFTQIWDGEDGTSSLYVKASAGYPFLGGAPQFLTFVTPNIDYRAEFIFRCKDPGSGYQAKIRGSHNKFPAYEGIIAGKVIYSFRPTAKGPGIGNLNSSVPFETDWFDVP